MLCGDHASSTRCPKPRGRANGTHPGSARAFKGGTGEWLAKYDRGEFCHSPVGGGTALASSFYGETCIPAVYVPRKWVDRFRFRKFVDADRTRFWQSVIVVQKP